MKLHLGFEDRPYVSRPSKGGKTPYGQGKTTQEVAKELEDRYKIVEAFWEMEQDIFTESLEDAFAEDLEEIMTMKTPSRKGFSFKGTDVIEARFRRNLTSRRYDGVIPGVPTLAAQRGVSHLEQKPYAKRGSRPSFIDTGRYRQSFRAWVEDWED
jgi:hypothetical protein